MADAKGAELKDGEDQEEEKDPVFPYDYPLVLRSDMLKNQILNIIRMVMSSLDTNQGDVPITLREVKKKLDQAYHPNWNILIGGDFGYRLWAYQTDFVHFAIGKIGVLVWRS